MRRSVLGASSMALLLLLVGGCGKYGAPHRTGSAPATATLPSSPIPPPYFGTEGTGIENPTSDPLPVPTAPPEEPEDEPTP